MRWSVLIISTAISAISLIQAGEKTIPCDGEPLTQCIAKLSLDKAVSPDFLKKDYEFETRTFHVKSFKGRPWFKPLVLTYWAVAAFRSYGNEDEFRLDGPMPYERTISAGFDPTLDTRIIMVPRKTPFFYFPIGKNARVDHLWAIYVTGHGGAVTYAVDLNRFHKRPN